MNGLAGDSRKPVTLVDPTRPAGTRNGGSSSTPGLVEVEDPGAELVAHPQVAVLAALQRLGIDVGAGQQPIGPLDGEADDVVRVPELDEVADVDRSRAAAWPS